MLCEGPLTAAEEGQLLTRAISSPSTQSTWSLWPRPTMTTQSSVCALPMAHRMASHLSSITYLRYLQPQQEDRQQR